MSPRPEPPAPKKGPKPGKICNTCSRSEWTEGFRRWCRELFAFREMTQEGCEKWDDFERVKMPGQQREP